jgi:hypothetical protein
MAVLTILPQLPAPKTSDIFFGLDPPDNHMMQCTRHLFSLFVAYVSHTTCKEKHKIIDVPFISNTTHFQFKEGEGIVAYNVKEKSD